MSQAKAIMFRGIEILAQGKVKKIKFTLEQAITACRGSAGIAILFL
jgi:hypothetical protein